MTSGAINRVSLNDESSLSVVRRVANFFLAYDLRTYSYESFLNLILVILFKFYIFKEAKITLFSLVSLIVWPLNQGPEVPPGGSLSLLQVHTSLRALQFHPFPSSR